MINDFYDLIYRMSYIVRYSAVPRIKDENIAEHTFFVSAIVMKLHEKYKFNLGIALQISVAHDVPETEIGDVTHTTKIRFPKLSKILDEIEDEIADDFPLAISEGIRLYNGGSIESKIVHLADAMQCHQYSKNEMSLGNNGYMTTVYTHSFERIEDIEKELKSYEY